MLPPLVEYRRTRIRQWNGGTDWTDFFCATIQSGYPASELRTANDASRADANRPRQSRLHFWVKKLQANSSVNGLALGACSPPFDFSSKLPLAPAHL
jgi:hypothetical protein